MIDSCLKNYRYGSQLFWLLIIIYILFSFLNPAVLYSDNLDSLLKKTPGWETGYTLDTLIIKGETYFPLQTVKNELNLDYYQNKAFEPTTAELILSKLVDYYLEQGFPFCTIGVDSVLLDDSLKTISFSISLQINSMTIISFVKYDNIKTNKLFVLNRQARFKLPFIFDQRILSAAEQYLYASELFREYPQWKIVQQQEHIFGIDFNLMEEKYNSLDAVLGYSQQAEKGTASLRGKVEVTFRNLFGTLRQLKINWQRRSEKEEAIYLFYKEPWLLNIPLASFVSFTQNFQDKSYLERYYTAGVDYQASYYLNLLADYTYGEIMPDSLLIIQGEQKVEKQIFGAGLRFKKSNRQKEYFRTDFRLATVLKNLKYEDKEEHGYQVEWLNEWKKKIGSQFYLKQQLRAEYTGADSLSSYDLSKFGGLTTIRGFFENQFSSDLYFLNRNDLIWQAADNTELFVFDDMAYYNKMKKFVDWSGMEWISGVGCGLRFENNLGTFEISYGISTDEGFSTAKIHFQYINEF